MTNLHKEETNLFCIESEICPLCAMNGAPGIATVEDQWDDLASKTGKSADESDPIYFDRCPKCGWNNGPKN